MPPRKRRTFTREFKESAVRELQTSGATLAEVSERLGVSIGNLSQWRTQLGALKESNRKPDAEKAGASGTAKDVTALLKEIAQLKEERDTLRKALSYLAKDL